MSTIDFVNDAITLDDDHGWDDRVFTRRHLHLALIREEDGTYSAVVLNLPGAGSCGPTEDDAVENAKEAVLGVIESHKAAGEDVPWIDCRQEDIPAGAKVKWVLVDA